MSVHPIIGVIPTAASQNPVDKDGLRSSLVSDYIKWLDPDSDPTEYDPRDTTFGTVTSAVSWRGRIYERDEASSAEHDGAVVLTLADGVNYVLATADLVALSVLDKDLATPPTEMDSPPVELGDAYIVPDAANDDWASHPDDIAIWTGAGWHYAEPRIGQLVFVRDEELHYKFTENGWEVALEVDAESITASKFNPALAHYWRVVNQTTNTPPGSPTVGDAYIIGDSPTGAWVGHSYKVAVCEVDGSFVIYTPREGDVARDLALNLILEWSGSAWQSNGGGLIARWSNTDPSPSVTSGGSGQYTISTTTPPTTSLEYKEDTTATRAHAARSATNLLRFTYSFSWAGAGGQPVVALFRDSESNAIAWTYGAGDQDNTGFATAVFEITAGDAVSHTYKFRLIDVANMTLPNPVRRFVELMEFSA